MFFDVERAVDTVIQGGWTDTPVFFDNQTPKPTLGNPYIDIEVNWSDGNQIGIKKHRQSGYIVVSVYTNKGAETGLSGRLLDKMEQLLITGPWPSGLRLNTAHVERVGERESWYQRDLIVPFDYDFCR